MIASLYICDPMLSLAMSMCDLAMFRFIFSIFIDIESLGTAVGAASLNRAIASVKEIMASL
jgi:hypothetical protein